MENRLLMHEGFEQSYSKEVWEVACSIDDINAYKQLADEVMEIKFKEHNEGYRTLLLSSIMTVMEQKQGFFENQKNEAYVYISNLRVFDD